MIKIVENNKGIRSFIAISLPDNIKIDIGNLSQQLKKNLTSSNIIISWVKPESIHLTLKFLGTIDSSQIEPIVLKLNEIAAQTKPFSIAIEGLGVFPNFSHPRVLWVGIKGSAKEIGHLQRSIEEKMGELGFPSEKKEFNAHFTLGRIKSIKSRGIIGRAFHDIENQKIGNMEINNIKLIKSTLLSSGAVYEQLGIAKFDQNKQ
ncbi:MAG: RNA 2',3'-cyclic phosphodiesterase [bacterium]